ncbi:long-chain fatty acid--CoA ligase [Thalassospiraceae bacterium LMO-JJ14]|nr:long-chain fatty acid--CoA ligase [Thalassospiraceae bacterium LMO-JJ14]
MFDLAAVIDLPPFSMAQPDKDSLFGEALGDLTRHHYAGCGQYRRILDALGFDPSVMHTTREYPYLPVRLFKDFELMSVPPADIVKTLTSSGTSGQAVSKIFLDQTAAVMQTKVLSKIVGDFIGPQRLPMLVIDSASVVKDRRHFSARGAGIIGFSMFGRDVTYALDENMALDMAAIEAFSEKHKGGPVLLFGFTSIVFLHLIEALAEKGLKLPFEQGILIHGGGWKKLADIAVDNDAFKARLADVTGIERVHNYYGMVEQTGSIFMECEAGRLHSSIFSDIVIRGNDFSECGQGEKGLVELVSLLPSSYPGHVLITEDIGEWLGVDDCPCGRLGKTFAIHGRVRQAEVRGCSDTFTS